MALFEDILPELRKGRWAQRTGWINRGPYGLPKAFPLSQEDITADDWELVPGKKRHKVTMFLWNDGQVTLSPSRVYFTGEKAAWSYEIRTIEWESE